MIAGKYNEPRPTKSELQYKLESLRKEAKILNEIENMDVDHFRYKKLFFRDQKMELIIPILRIINISLAKKFNLLINGVA
jgi:hypothetical protein